MWSAGLDWSYCRFKRTTCALENCLDDNCSLIWCFLTGKYITCYTSMFICPYGLFQIRSLCCLSQLNATQTLRWTSIYIYATRNREGLKEMTDKSKLFKLFKKILLEYGANLCFMTALYEKGIQIFTSNMSVYFKIFFFVRFNATI